MKSFIGMGSAHFLGGLVCGVAYGFDELCAVQVVGGLVYFTIAAALRRFA